MQKISFYFTASLLSISVFASNPSEYCNVPSDFSQLNKKVIQCEVVNHKATQKFLTVFPEDVNFGCISSLDYDFGAMKYIMITPTKLKILDDAFETNISVGIHNPDGNVSLETTAINVNCYPVSQ